MHEPKLHCQQGIFFYLPIKPRGYIVTSFRTLLLLILGCMSLNRITNKTFFYLSMDLLTMNWYSFERLCVSFPHFYQRRRWRHQQQFHCFINT